MASLKECRARARKAGLTVHTIPKTHRAAQKYRFRLNGYHCRDVADLSKAITTVTREKKIHGTMRQLNGHRLKYGYTTVPRKRRRKP